MSGEVRAIEKILKQNGRKLTGKYKKYLGTLSKPELNTVLATFKREVEAWHKTHAEMARKLEEEQAAVKAVPATDTTEQPVRKIQLRKPGDNTNV